MRRYFLALFSALATTTAQQPFGNEDGVKVYVDAYLGSVGATETLKSLGCHGTTPIHCAAQQGNVKAIRTLSQLGADVNIQRINGDTPVYVAAEFGQAEAITVLAELGANVDTPGRWVDETPVYAAARTGHPKAVATLLAEGADASIGISRLKAATLVDGITPFGSIVAFFETIIDSPEEGNTPLKIARIKRDKSAKHEEVARLLEAHFEQYPNGVKPVEPYNPPILTQFHEASKAIPDVDVVDSESCPSRAINSRP